MTEENLMIEKLLSCSILLSVGLMPHKDYTDTLDALFMEMPENNLLLDLEFNTSDIDKTISEIKIYSAEHDIDFAVFGKFLIKGLKKAYFDSVTDIKGFAYKIYAIWNMLPSSIQTVEPFWTMNYGDDPLSWGDVEQTKNLYEKMLQFYDW